METPLNRDVHSWIYKGPILGNLQTVKMITHGNMPLDGGGGFAK